MIDESGTWTTRHRLVGAQPCGEGLWRVIWSRHGHDDYSHVVDRIGLQRLRNNRTVPDLDPLDAA